MIRVFKYHPKLTIILIVVALGTAAAAVLPVSIMEARNFITAREMLTDGNWLLTTMNGEARYEKPPLPTWLSAISASIFGISTFSMRLPALITVILLGIFTNKITFLKTQNYRLSLLAAVICITSFYVLAIVIEAPWDIYAHTFMLMSIYFGLVFIERKSNNYLPAIALIIFGTAGFMSKGPIPYYALFLPFFVSLLISYGAQLRKTRLLFYFVLIIVAIGVGSLWYIYVRVQDPHTFETIATKETSNWSSYNVRPFYYYWSFFTQSGLWTIPALLSLLYPYIKKRVKHPKFYTFSWLWTILAVVLLSIIPEKKSRYLMPVLIPLALTISNYILYVVDDKKRLSKLERSPLYLHFGIITIVALAIPIAIWYFLGQASDNLILNIILSIISLAIGLFSLLALLRFNMKNSLILSVLFMVMVGSLAPLIFNSYNSEIKASKTAIAALKDSDKLIYGLLPLSPEFIWYYGDKISILEKSGLNEEGNYILTEYRKDSTSDSLAKDYNWKLLETFDFNQNSDTTNSSYKDRLKAGLYFVSKQE